ncbi:glycosyltransferase domain-containing protein [Scandinavium sp. M-37]|uniref:glycosyltransferase domain-containing protein n=1 Tax=Scandinavium sp. M-37 TaxID=3373077 RepID=UPI0037469247
MVNLEESKNRLVIYSVITGGYDKVLPVENIDSDCDYYIVSNEHIVLPEPWKLLTPSTDGLDNKNFNRYYKINPHILFPNHQHSLYIDGNILLCGDIYNWSKAQLSNNDFAIFNHPERDNIFDEGKICSFIGTDYFWVINRQLKKYKAEGFNYRELFEANILLRSHNKADVMRLMEMWWSEYSSEFSAKRDQLALPYVIWKMNYKINNMGSSDARFDQEYFKYMSHANNRHATLSTKLKKIINRTIGSLFNV